MEEYNSGDEVFVFQLFNALTLFYSNVHIGYQHNVLVS